MAIYHCSAKVISRGGGRSAVAAAAYRSATKIENEYDGVTHDYTRKQGVVYSEVMLPDNAPEAYRDRANLWNAVEKNERANGQLAQEYEFSIPIELPQSEWIAFARRTVDELFVQDGRPADIAIHFKETDGKPNPHVHIQSPKRAMDADGNWEAKSEILYLCKNAKGDEKAFTKAELALPENSEWQKQHRYSKDGNPKGKKVYLSPYEVATNPKYKGYERVKGDRQPKTEKHGRKNPKMERWDSKEYLLEIRKGVADKINAELERMGLPQRVDHRSLKDQGIDREPTIHEGVAARNIEKKGGVADRCEVNRDIKQANVQTAAIDKQMSEVEMEIGRVQEDIEWTEIHEQGAKLGSFIFAGRFDEAAQMEAVDKLYDLQCVTEATLGRQEWDGLHDGVTYQTDRGAVAYLDYHGNKAKEDQGWMEKNISNNLDFIRSIPHAEQYEYGKLDLEKINVRYRAERGDEGYLRIVQRSPMERNTVMDIKASITKSDQELYGLYDTTYIHRLIAEQNQARKKGKPAESREEILVRQIQDSFATLRFIEQKQLCSLAEIKTGLQELQIKQEYCVKEIADAERMVSRLETAEKAMGDLREIQVQRAHGNFSPEQQQREKECLRTLGASTNSQVKLTAEDLQLMRSSIQEYRDRIEALKQDVSVFSAEMGEYRNCIATLERIDRESRPQPALSGPVQEQTRKPERAAELPKAEPQAVPERKQPTKETPRVDRPKAEPKVVPFDVPKVAMQLVQHRTDFIRESIKAQQPSYYTPNVVYRQQAQRITDCVGNIRQFRDTKSKLVKERDALGLFQGKKKKELDGKITDFERRARQEEAKLEPMAKSWNFSVSDLAGAEAAAKQLKEKAAQEDAKAKAALANVGAAERANTAKLEFLALAKTVPEDKKQAVLDAIGRDGAFVDTNLSVGEITEGEKLAQQQLDVVLLPKAEANGKEERQKADHTHDNR